MILSENLIIIFHFRLCLIISQCIYCFFFRLIRFLKPVDDLRTSFQYNNLMYGLMAVVPEILGGKSWEELMIDRLYKPLGMDASTFVSDKVEELENVQVPYLPHTSGLKPVSWNVLRYVELLRWTFL